MLKIMKLFLIAVLLAIVLVTHSLSASSTVENGANDLLEKRGQNVVNESCCLRFRKSGYCKYPVIKNKLCRTACCYDMLSENSCKVFKASNKCDSPSFGKLCQKTCNRCDMKWRRVTKAMIKSTVKVGVNLQYTDVRGGLVITGSVTNNGCGKGPGSRAITFIRGGWIKIKYTQEFRGSASCWKIFGDAVYSKQRRNNLIDFSAAAGDKISNEYRMNSVSDNKFDGRVYRCDNEKQNFWHSLNGSGLRHATVVLRRSPKEGDAGISTWTSCGRPSYVIKDIYVLM